MSKINWDSLYSSGLDFYRVPEEPNPGDLVTVRFRTMREDVDSVTLEILESGERKTMLPISSDHYFDYYESQIQLGEENLSYAFRIKKGEEELYYNRLGVTVEENPAYAFRLLPGFHVPNWVKGTIMYQIYIDRFHNGDSSNDVESREYIYLGRPATKVEDWDAPVEAFDVHRFYGGDLQGVLDKLDYIYSLGVRGIYFNPLFVSPSNHKYDTQDYDYIDPHIGKIVSDGGEVLKEGDTDNHHAEKYRIRTTNRENLEASNQLFVQFVEACHQRGIRVIIDGVFNHCGSFNKWMNKDGFYSTELSQEGNVYAFGAYESAQSPYRSYFAFGDERDSAWPGNDTYEKWWGNDTLPKLNYEESKALEEDILRIAKKWVSPPFNCDGWRLDVAADLGHSEEYNHSFWRRFRRGVKGANPEAVILAEHYGNPVSWLAGDQWDTVMNYDAFMEPVTYFLTGMEKHSDSSEPTLLGDGEHFMKAMSYTMARLPEQSILSSMNQLSNHDHSRFMTRTNKRVGRIGQVNSIPSNQDVNPAIYRLGAMMQMTWPGAPTIFYGDEVGMCGWTEPDSRKTFPWGKEDLELLEYHRYLGDARRTYSQLALGGWIFLMAGKNYVVYARSLGTRIAIIAINASAEEFPLTIPAWRVGVTDTVCLRRVLKSNENGYNAGTTHRYTRNGSFRCYMEAYAGKIYVADLDYWSQNSRGLLKKLKKSE